MGFFRQEDWSGLPFAFPGDLPIPGIKPMSPTLAGVFFATEPLGKPVSSCFSINFITTVLLLPALKIPYDVHILTLSRPSWKENSDIEIWSSSLYSKYFYTKRTWELQWVHKNNGGKEVGKKRWPGALITKICSIIQEDSKKKKENSQSNFFLIKSKYSWFTMLCYFQVYSKMIQIYI